MQKVEKTDLTFEEELLVAIYHNNVEKLKWLIEMDNFKPSMVTEPVDFGEVSVPLYWLTICYHYMLRDREFDDARKPVNDILSIWKERFHLNTDELIDLNNCYHSYQPYHYYPDDVSDLAIPPLTMGLKDYLQAGAREMDHVLSCAIGKKDTGEIIRLLNQGAVPDAKVMDKCGHPTSAISIFRNSIMYYRRWYLWGEEKPVEKWMIESILRKGLEEMILSLLERNIQQRTDVPVETFLEDDNLQESSDYYIKEPSPEMKEKIENFIQEIDKPGAILTMFDEGKAFARCRYCEYEYLYAYIINRIFKESKHIVIRVGGYSFRVAEMVINMVKSQPKNRIYVEYLSKGSVEDEWTNKDPRMRTIGMGKYKFRKDMDIVKEADEYDFKTFGNRSVSHTMVHFYVNNIDTGWYKDNGEFMPFYNKYRGLQAITDVIMIKGYDVIAPATAAMSTFTFNSGGDMIFAGGTVHKDRRSRTSSQRKLIEKAGINLLDLTFKIH